MKQIKFPLILLVGIMASVTLSSCLLTVGAPLARKVEPGKWTVEGSAGLMAPYEAGQNPSIHAYLYVGRALGKHFEIGLLPYYYKVNSSGVIDVLEAGVIALPFKWDPFNYSSPFHLTIFAVPSLFMGDLHGFLLYEGIGLSYDFDFPLQLYASYSIPYYGFQLFTGNLGLRYKLNSNLTLGGNFMFSSLLGYGLNLTLSTALGK